MVWERLQKLLDRAESRWALLQLLGFTGGTGALSAWGAAATDWLAAWGPIAWVAAGLIGMAAAGLLLLLYSTIQLRLARARYTESASKGTKSINPLAESFENIRIKAVDFFSPIEPVVRGKQFTRCEFVGPATIILNTCTFSDTPTFYRCNFVRIKEQFTPMGLTVMAHCLFKDIVFYECTIGYRDDDEAFDIVPENMIINADSPREHP